MSDRTPTISLVTPSLNQARYLGVALQSVREQEYRAIEHVVVDGGSTDGSREIVAQAPGLAWWCSEPDGGMYAAINKGFARTSGDIMGWLNSDDLLLPGALRAVGEIFAGFPEIEWLSSLALSTWTQDDICHGVAAIEGFARAAFLDGGYLPGAGRQYGWIPQESTFWRRSLWERTGARIDSSLELAGDFELWSRFYDHAELVGTPTPLGGFRRQSQQKSRDLDRYVAEARPGLAAARARHSQPRCSWRRLLVRFRLASLPGVRRVLCRRFGYPARRVVADTAGGWKIENYRFL